jgi:ABC-type multidrug transport system ATPase subunit
LYEELNEDVSLGDPDVLQEASKVEGLTQADMEQRYPLVLRHMRKVYPGASRAAVKNLSLAVMSSECFGLLGENGAGKSTAIAILTGLFPASSGDGFIAGHSVTNDLKAVHRYIGVCPQFSVLWDQLTVREHLYFFARLKGVPLRHETRHVDKALVDYGLVNEGRLPLIPRALKTLWLHSLS